MGKSCSGMVSYNPAKFGGHRHSGSGDVMFLVCCMVLKDHMIIWSCDSTGQSHSWYVTTLPRLVAIGAVVVEICF